MPFLDERKEKSRCKTDKKGVSIDSADASVALPTRKKSPSSADGLGHGEGRTQTQASKAERTKNKKTSCRGGCRGGGVADCPKRKKEKESWERQTRKKVKGAKITTNIFSHKVRLGHAA